MKSKWKIITAPLLWFVCAASLAYASLFVAYFGSNATPPWISDILWITGNPNAVVILCFLEAAALTGVLSLVASVHFQSSIHRRRGYKSIGLPEILVFIFALVATFSYAAYKISTGNNVEIRLVYAFFSTMLLCLWFRSAHVLIRTSFVELVALSRTLEQVPESVFSSGRQLSSAVNRTSISIVALLVPLLVWLPTLIPGPVFPRNIALFVGGVVSLAILAAPLYAQIRASEAVKRSLEKIDSHITVEMRELPKRNKEEIEHMQVLLDLRDNLQRSVRLPASAIFLPIIQFITILSALIASFRDILP